MKKLTIDNIKAAYSDVAELMISLDTEGRLILTSREAIYEYIKSLPLGVQIFIVWELMNLFKDNLISESCLKPNDRKGLNIYPFDGFCQLLESGIKSKMKEEDRRENEKAIERIKTKIEKLKDKKLRINHLLGLKRDWDSFASYKDEEILKKDMVYSFIIKELEYWERFNEIESGVDYDTESKRLQSKLTTEQRGLFFKLLKNDGFILPNTDPDCFNWAIAVTYEEEPKQPRQWQPIQFLFNSNHSLRILLYPILGTITNQHIRDIELLFKDKQGGNFILPKDQKRYSGDTEKIQEMLESLNIEKQNWYTIEKKQTN